MPVPSSHSGFLNHPPYGHQPAPPAYAVQQTPTYTAFDTFARPPEAHPAYSSHPGTPYGVPPGQSFATSVPPQYSSQPNTPYAAAPGPCFDCMTEPPYAPPYPHPHRASGPPTPYGPPPEPPFGSPLCPPVFPPPNQFNYDAATLQAGHFFPDPDTSPWAPLHLHHDPCMGWTSPSTGTPPPGYPIMVIDCSEPPLEEPPNIPFPFVPSPSTSIAPQPVVPVTPTSSSVRRDSRGGPTFPLQPPTPPSTSVSRRESRPGPNFPPQPPTPPSTSVSRRDPRPVNPPPPVENYEGLRIELEVLQRELKTSRSNENALQRTLGELEDHLAALGRREKKSVRFEEEISALRQQLEAAQRHNVRVESDRESAENEIARLQRALEEERGLHGSMDDVLELQGRLAEAQACIQSMASEQDEEHERATQLHSQLTAANEAAWKLRSEFDEETGRLRTQLRVLQERLAKAESAQATTGQHQLVETQRKYDAERAKMQQEIFALQHRLASYEEGLAGAGSEVERLEEELRKEVTAREAAHQRLLQAQRNFDSDSGQRRRESDSFQQRVAVLEAERSRYQQDARREAEAREVAESKVRQMEADVADYEAKVRELSPSRQRPSTEASEAPTGELTELRHQVSALKERVAKYETLDRRGTQDVDQLRDELWQQTTACADAQEQLARVQRQLQEVEQERLRQTGPQATPEQGRQEAAAVRNLREQLTQAECDLDAAREDAAACRARLAEVEIRIAGSAQPPTEGAISPVQSQITSLQQESEVFQKQASYWEARWQEADQLQQRSKMQISQLQARLSDLEGELQAARAEGRSRSIVQSRGSTRETYKVKTFEIAARLARMDGADDGLYHGLPIEVEGEGLYRELVAAGRVPNLGPSSAPYGATEVTVQSPPTYKVKTLEMAEKLARIGGSGDGTYQGLAIEVEGEGMYSDLLNYTGRTGSSVMSPLSEGAVEQTTYKVKTMEMADRLAKIGGTGDGTYQGLPIEVVGQGLYRDLVPLTSPMGSPMSGRPTASPRTPNSTIRAGDTFITPSTAFSSRPPFSPCEDGTPRAPRTPVYS